MNSNEIKIKNSTSYHSLLHKNPKHENETKQPRKENSWSENTTAFAQKIFPFSITAFIPLIPYTQYTPNSSQEKEKFQVPTVLKVLEVQSC